MRLYAITDAAQLSSSPDVACEILVALVRDWAASGVDYIQIREKALTSRALETLAGKVMEAVQASRPEKGIRTKVMVNGRADIAIAVGADGVHLPGSGALTPNEVRFLFVHAGRKPPIISVACHSAREIEAAREAGATMALFAPVFGKVVTASVLSSIESARSLPGVGLAGLQAACRAAGSMPVFALGGVTQENAASCLEAGAAGIAAIRLFQSYGWQAL